MSINHSVPSSGICAPVPPWIPLMCGDMVPCCSHGGDQQMGYVPTCHLPCFGPQTPLPHSTRHACLPAADHCTLCQCTQYQCAHERGSGTRQHDSRHVTLAGRTEGAPPNTIHPSTQPFTIDPLPRPNASTTRSPPPSSQRPSLTRWSRVEL